MARKYKRDTRGRFARTASSAKKRYQKGHKGAGAIHRRRKAQWSSGRKRDKAKVIYKSGIFVYGAPTHAVSFIRNEHLKSKRKRK